MPGGMKYLKERMSALPVEPWEKEENIKKYGFRTERVKISAEEMMDNILCADFPGFIDTDIMVVFKQLYPTAEVGRGSSLNFYLRMNKLEGKEDMPYKRMFRIYEFSLQLERIAKALAGYVETAGAIFEMPKISASMDGVERDGHPAEIDVALANVRKFLDGIEATKVVNEQLRGILRDLEEICLELMRLIAKYCIVDAFRCQQLQRVRSILDDKRELSTMSYVSLYDSFYRANGMKVRHLVAAHCYEAGIMFSNARVENERRKTFTGAWVFPPVKGLNNRRPITGLDASSLYPSIMMAYNYSPEKVIEDDAEGKGRAQVEQLRAAGYQLQDIEFEWWYKDDPDTVPHVKMHGWSVRHNGVMK